MLLLLFIKILPTIQQTQTKQISLTIKAAIRLQSDNLINIMQTTKDVQFPSGDNEGYLSGTLYLPQRTEESHKEQQQQPLIPGAIIIHGSGPVDRNGNVKSNILGCLGNINLNTHNLLAEELVDEQNMAMLLYDKRGIGQSKNKSNKNWYYEAGLYDLVNDAVQAYRYLGQQDTVDENKIVLIGHSEGAIILPLIAETILAQNDLKPPKGLIFLAGFGETLDNAMHNQRERILQEVQTRKGCEGWILRKVLTKEKLEKQHDEYIEIVKDENKDFYSQYCGLVKVPTKWYRQHSEWNAKKSLVECTQPCLAITGGKDVQVESEYCDPERARTIAPKSVSLETHIVPNLTHILRSIDGEPTILDIPKEYPKLGKQPLDSDLVEIINQWLNKLL